MCGTENCYPPEFFRGDYFTTGESLDRWCVALVLYNVLEGTIAFDSQDEITTKPLILSNNHSPEYLDFIRQMLHKNGLNRFDSYGIINHSWIRH